MLSKCMRYAKAGYECASEIAAAASQTSVVRGLRNITEIAADYTGASDVAAVAKETAVAAVRKVKAIVADPRIALAEGRKEVFKTVLKVKAIATFFRREDIRFNKWVVIDCTAAGLAFVGSHFLANKVQDHVGGLATTAFVALTVILPAFLYKKTGRDPSGPNIAVKGMQGALIAASPSYAVVSVPVMTYIAIASYNQQCSKPRSKLDCAGSAAGALLMDGSQLCLGNGFGGLALSCGATLLNGFIANAYGNLQGRAYFKRVNIILMDTSAKLLKAPRGGCPPNYPHPVWITEPREALCGVRWDISIFDAEYAYRDLDRQRIELVNPGLESIQRRKMEARSALGETFHKDALNLIMAYDEQPPAYKLIYQPLR